MRLRAVEQSSHARGDNDIDFINGPAGRLQLVVDEPEQDAHSIAVVCHPHTLHGGTLTNKVVHQLARTFVELGAVTVRFNFRGAGNSEGEYDAGPGEAEDLDCVVNWARGKWPGLRLWLAGFSFGAYVVSKSANRQEPAWLVTIAPPVNLYDFDKLRVTVADWLLILGSEDEVVPTHDVLAWVQSLHAQPNVALVPQAGHFFHGRLNQLKNQLLENAPR